MRNWTEQNVVLLQATRLGDEAEIGPNGQRRVYGGLEWARKKTLEADDVAKARGWRTTTTEDEGDDAGQASRVVCDKR